MNTKKIIIITFLAVMLLSGIVFAKPQYSVRFLASQNQVKFSRIRIVPGTTVATTTAPGIEVEVKGNVKSPWRIELKCSPLVHTQNSKYKLSKIYIDVNGTVSGPGGKTSNVSVIRENNRKLTSGVMVMAAPANTKGRFQYTPGNNNIKLYINSNDDIIAGKYRGSLQLTLTGTP